MHAAPWMVRWEGIISLHNEESWHQLNHPSTQKGGYIGGKTTRIVNLFLLQMEIEKACLRTAVLCLVFLVFSGSRRRTAMAIDERHISYNRMLWRSQGHRGVEPHVQGRSEL